MTDKGDPMAATRLATTGDGERTRIPTARGSAEAGIAATTQSGSQSLLVPGTILNNTQRIEALVGRGGMGEVYRAINIHTGDYDAIKVIRPDLATDPQVRELFRREAGALRKVRHPAVVSYEGVFGDDSGRVFLVMDYVDGPSLASVIAKAPLAPNGVRRVGVQIAEGLAAAHACGVAHRDLSPDNVVLRGGSLDHAVLIDFGVAKRLDGGSTLIGSGFAGKLDYCSPEQCGLFEDRVDHRTDIYSLGLVLAAAAVGKPLPMGSSMARAVKVRETQPDLSGVPEELRRDLARLLEPDPARRAQSMREVAALLSYNVIPEQAPPPTKAGGQARTIAWIGGGLAVVVLGIGTGVAIGPQLMAVIQGETPDKPPDPNLALEEQQRRAAEAARHKADDDRRAAEARRQAEEDARRQEADRAAAEQHRLEEEARRKTEVDQRAADEARLKAETDKRAAEAEKARIDEETRRKAEADEKVRLEEDARRRAAAEKARVEDEARRKAEADERARLEEDTRRRTEAEKVRAENEARRKAQAEKHRLEEDARRKAEDEKRAAEDARRRADEERRRREAAAHQPPTPPVQPPAARPPLKPTPAPVPVPVGVDGAWRGTICFRRLALTAGNETCGPLSLSIAGTSGRGNWVVNGLTYGIAGAFDGAAGKVTLDMPPTGQGSSLGAKFTLPIRLNGGALQGEGYTINSVLVKFSAGR